ncbi:MAG TPA: hypothetical protein VHY37_08675 [Tepidisphaeraceae bacterium]|jgi:hypothetical protein|nr:hypothetical protein [Tepidisphaeraceae bacterium]
MNENFTQPSDNSFDVAASVLRRPDPPAQPAKAPFLSDLPERSSPRDEPFYEPERWDGLS